MCSIFGEEREIYAQYKKNCQRRTEVIKCLKIDTIIKILIQNIIYLYQWLISVGNYIPFKLHIMFDLRLQITLDIIVV